jgi:hypothetical protein
MTLATPVRAPIGVIDPVAVARGELALIEALRARPGSALGAIAQAAGHTRSATADRLRRLAARGAVVRVAGRWRVAGDEPIEPEPELESESKRIRSVLRICRRVGSVLFPTTSGSRQARSPARVMVEAASRAAR